MSDHFLTPFPIFNVSLSNTCRSNQSDQVRRQENQFTWSHLIIYAFKGHIIHFFILLYWRTKLRYCPWSETRPKKLTLTECNKNVCLFVLTGCWPTHTHTLATNLHICYKVLQHVQLP